MNKSLAVIFDMDGVLVDSNPYHKIALKQFAQQHGYDLDEQQLREKIYGRTNKEWLTNLFGKLPDDLIHRYAEEKEQLYRDLFAQDIRPVKGLIKFLDLLESNNVPKAIATSAPPSNVSFTLSRTNTGHYFSTVLDDTFITHSKPHPEIYLKASAAIGQTPANCIVIEDSLSGVAAGKAAGCRVIGITTTHTPEELHAADFIIHDFDGLSMDVLNDVLHTR
ncbi:MAG: HAD family phosphatase [Cyclobacteriaceae bacterium]|nr:HAD family phosphatase [Cyclobacteriaceae bacterium]